MVLHILYMVLCCPKENFPKESGFDNLFLRKCLIGFIGSESNGGVQKQRLLKQPGEIRGA